MLQVRLKGYIHGGSNIYINLLRCNINIFIPSILQSYVFYWYHMYLLYPLMDKTEATIRQYLY